MQQNDPEVMQMGSLGSDDDSSVDKGVKGDGFDDMEPPDNGAFYCSFCNWWGTFYDRFDTPFVNFFNF